MLTDQTTRSSYSETFSGVNLSQVSILNGTTGYIGFTGGDGGATSTQTISNFSFNDYSTPISVWWRNPLSVAAPPLRSVSRCRAPSSLGGAGNATLSGGLSIGAGAVVNFTGGLTPAGSLAATEAPLISSSRPAPLRS